MAKNHHAKMRRTASLFREAVPKMSELNIPLTPENYHTWYEYTNGNNPELNKSIDELLQKGAKFTSKVNKELYCKHIGQSQEELIVSFQQDVKNLVSSLIEKIKGMTTTTENYSSLLEKYDSVLKSDPDLETITNLIANLIDDTGSVLESNQIMGSMLESMNEEVDIIHNNMKMLNTKAYTDQLTAVPNRRAFDEKIDELFESYHDEGQIFSLLLIDIDNFKDFNDKFGHDIGDRVLKYVASEMKGGVKGDDMVSRYGGEEFAVLLPNTDYADAISVGNNLRKKISVSKLVDKNSKHKLAIGYVTVSVGVAFITASDDIESIFRRADKALYLAKKNGRNQVFGDADL